MKRIAIALVIAGALALLTPKPAEAACFWWQPCDWCDVMPWLC